MNIHQNARLTPLGRERMVRAIASAFYRDVRDSPFGRVRVSSSVLSGGRGFPAEAEHGPAAH